MKTIQSFAKFGASNAVQANVAVKNAVIYTRVSSKEQFDKNLSLESQKHIIEDYARRNGLTITEQFGGTYESAKTDGRKEFQRMLDFVKKGKGKITHILVYMLDRFSRTGGGAIKLAEDLRDKYGVDIIAVTQPADTSNAGGVLQQSIQFIFSKYDNDLRRHRAITGIKEKLAKGMWATKPPVGYDVLYTNGEKKIVVNATGRKLRKAFVWKSEGMQQEAILLRLKKLGVPMYKQQLSRIFANPFYCGLMVHKMLDGKILEGTHEKLISKELFMRVNEIHESAHGYGVPHKKEQEQVPLKVFVYCDQCDQPFTGYIVKQKQLWYYKCRTKGCCCNKSAKVFHNMFTELLQAYTARLEQTATLQKEIEAIYIESNKEQAAAEKEYQKQLAEIEQRIENIEESYYVNKEMSRDKFEKYYQKLNSERAAIVKELPETGSSISNLSETIDKALRISAELPAVWASGDVKYKEKLQKLVFPEGIIYDREKQAFRTKRVNTVFSLIASLQGVSGKDIKKPATKDSGWSRSVGMTGFEPGRMGRKYNIVKPETRHCIGFERLQRQAGAAISVIPGRDQL